MNRGGAGASARGAASRRSATGRAGNRSALLGFRVARSSPGPWWLERPRIRPVKRPGRLETPSPPAGNLTSKPPRTPYGPAKEFYSRSDSATRDTQEMIGTLDLRTRLESPGISPDAG